MPKNNNLLKKIFYAASIGLIGYKGAVLLGRKTVDKISDSLNEAAQNALNKFAKLKYDSKKNRDENLQLKMITAKKELELEKEKNRNIITGVSGSSIVLGLLIFGYYKKQKHKQEKLQEIYKTETRIAKKIHDEVANDVYNIMNKIQYTTKTYRT